MKHLGDITKIKGCSAPVVDCIIGGSPCQDLSVAGKRAGLAGERSGLYMEQIRIIKEMRHKDELRGRTGESIRPRYMVWENVPGAFSSNQGKDFAAVIEEAIKIAEPEAPNVDVPEKGWPTSGCLYDEVGKWSVAWRVMDAQFWGVPQRRRRICLVADFNGLNAPKIVFGEAEYNGSTERGGGDPSVGDIGDESRSSLQSVTNGVSRDFDESEQKRKATARDARDGIGGAVPCTLKIRGGCEGGGKGALIQKDKSATLSTLQDQTLFQPVFGIDQQGGKGGANFSVDVMPPILSDSHGTPHAVAYSLEPGIAAREGGHIYEGISGTLRAKAGDNQMSVAYGIQGSMIGRADHNGPQGDGVNEDVSFNLNTTDRHAVVYGISPYHSNCMLSDNPHSGYYEADTARTLDALQCGYPGCNQGGMAVVQPVIDQHILDDQGGSQISVRNDGKCPTLRAETHGNLPCVMETFHASVYENVSPPLKARDYKDPHIVASVDCRNATELPGQNITLQSSCCHNLNSGNVVRVKHIVRRLTPLECERLQGFPDGWTDIGEWVDTKGKKHKEADSPRYKALGNSIALPPWKWVLKRLCACYERDATMASLFDGIGGFPLIWEQLNGKGSCLWASEIEEFPMAVTRLRFGGETIEQVNDRLLTQPKVETEDGVQNLWIDNNGDFKCPVCGDVSEYVTKHCPECGAKLIFGGDNHENHVR